ncbi:formimidoylglutamase [Metabacillus sp. cB07]|uniref:formimidoylglutamase n=1 Tax=Metabacillus sp. cB07 TaxID=2806989 RepID=UPI00193A3771|nr:formimidoylglutamase [Metabacillus sp. cB07]
MSGLPYLSHEAGFTDRGITKAGKLLGNWKEGDASGIGLIGVPLSKPSISHSGASFAPQTIRKMMNAFTTYSVQDDMDIKPITDFGDITMHVTDLSDSIRRIEETAAGILNRHSDILPIFLGGDHSVTAPLFKSFKEARGKAGIIQFDAHHDLRNLEDGGPSNGTPFRQLIEKDVLEGRHLHQIGIRNFSNGKVYTDYGKQHGVRIYTMQDVYGKGILPILETAVHELLKETDQIYVSLDMDIMDQAFAPGCPAIGPGGMDARMLIEAMRFLGETPQVKALDIVEIDPAVDFRDMTSRLAAHAILTFLSGYQNRK